MAALTPEVPVLTNSAVDSAGRVLRRLARGEPVDPLAMRDAYMTAAAYRDLHASPMQRVTNGVSHYIRMERGDTSIRAGQRFKRMDRIIQKLGRLSTRLSQMEDIGGCRAVLESREQVYAVVERIRRRWRNAVYIDYIKNPKPSGYRAFHIIERRDGRLIEVQLRTRGQHDWARAVETWVRPTVNFNLKDGEGPALVKDYFRAAAEITALEETGRVVDDDLTARFDELRYRVVAIYIEETEEEQE